MPTTTEILPPAVMEGPGPASAATAQAAPLSFMQVALGQLRAETKLPAPALQHTSAKGVQTRALILDEALGLAMRHGLESLSIGGLASVVGMSKSGVFAHFGSREDLQLSVIAEYHRRFEQEVFFPALQQPRGLPRLRAMFGNWMQRTAVELDSGCIHVSGAVEFGDKEGVVRDALVASVQIWHQAMHRAIAQCIALGELQADLDVQQVLFEILGLILSLHHEARFTRTPGAWQRAQTGFDNIMQRYAARP